MYRKHNYINKNISQLKTNIYEYDMSEAGFSLIKNYGLLDENTIQQLENNYNKQERTIVIGQIMQNNKELVNNLMKAFIEIRRQFFEKNELNNEDVLSIKKDAIFTINKNCKNLIYGENSIIEFKQKNIYSSYLYFNNIELYYNKNKDILDIKGLGKELPEHPLINQIKFIMKCVENINDKNYIFKILKDFRQKYLTYSLDKNFYRELNYNCNYSYKLKASFNKNYFYLDEIGEIPMEMIDISYNYINFILPIISILI